MSEDKMNVDPIDETLMDKMLVGKKLLPNRMTVVDRFVNKMIVDSVNEMTVYKMTLGEMPVDKTMDDKMTTK